MPSTGVPKEKCVAVGEVCEEKSVDDRCCNHCCHSFQITLGLSDKDGRVICPRCFKACNDSDYDDFNKGLTALGK